MQGLCGTQADDSTSAVSYDSEQTPTQPDSGRRPRRSSAASKPRSAGCRRASAERSTAKTRQACRTRPPAARERSPTAACRQIRREAPSRLAAGSQPAPRTGARGFLEEPGRARQACREGRPSRALWRRRRCKRRGASTRGRQRTRTSTSCRTGTLKATRGTPFRRQPTGKREPAGRPARCRSGTTASPGPPPRPSPLQHPTAERRSPGRTCIGCRTASKSRARALPRAQRLPGPPPRPSSLQQPTAQRRSPGRTRTGCPTASISRAQALPRIRQLWRATPLGKLPSRRCQTPAEEKKGLKSPGQARRRNSPLQQRGRRRARLRAFPTESQQTGAIRMSSGTGLMNRKPLPPPMKA
mmetsp:Transcript_9035/g.21747  ORF Transcript_9035/g.21747 Transcript_9035/m.21747 type:complete len:356 (-) Transcript_9035:2479-3546(-)